MRKCSHGVYWPDADPIALSCQQCNPDGTGEGVGPVLPRKAAGVTYHGSNEGRETCQCGCIRLSSRQTCPVCGAPYTRATERQVGGANPTREGVCPACGSNVHYETTKRSKWRCADCDTIYPALKVRK